MSTATVDTTGFGLTFDRPVARSLVHKTAIEQVFVTDFTQLADDEFACAGQLPRAHGYFSDTAHGCYDPLLLLEAGRQAVVYGIHEVMGVSRDNQFVFVSFELQVTDRAALAIGSHPGQLIGYSRTQNHRYVRGEPMAVEVVGDLFVDGRPCATIVGAGAFMSERMYRRVRSPRTSGDVASAGPPVAAAPALVGRRDPTNVVITCPERSDPLTFTTEVVVDRRHHTFFDHPLDHVPAVLLIESLRQTAVTAVCAAHGLDPSAAFLTHCAAKYGRFAEHDAPIRCVGTVEDGAEAGPIGVGLSMSQFDTSIADARVALDFLG